MRARTGRAGEGPLGKTVRRPNGGLALLLVALSSAAVHAQGAPPAPAGGDPAGKRLAATDITVAILDKRLGTHGTVTVKPGGRFRFGMLEGIAHACEANPPWERPLTAAFVELFVTPRSATPGAMASATAGPSGASPAMTTGRPSRVFSGWLFAESPSLNPVRHPAYDVWLRSCTIPAPDRPPERAAKRSRAPQSAPRASASESSDR